MKKRADVKARKKPPDVVRLADLTPRGRVKGGTGRRVFGEPLEPPDKDCQDSQPEEKRRP